MVGVVVTGHGGFAACMAANVKMLAGRDAEPNGADFAHVTEADAVEK